MFYIFKQSEDGKQYLLGKTTQINAANRKEVIAGWVSAELVKLCGSRSFFTYNNKVTSTINLPDGIAFKSDTDHNGYFTIQDFANNEETSVRSNCSESYLSFSTVSR